MFTNFKNSDFDLGKTDVFQCIGVIVGDVNISNNNMTIRIGENLFKLRYKKISVLQQLKKQVKKYGSKQYLLVYPIVTHFPGNRDLNISFDIVGFRGRDRENNKDSLDSKLLPFQFKVCGIWQFIPVCKIPCISVFRNKSKELIKFLGNCNILQRNIFAKPNHIPIKCDRSNMPKPFKFVKHEVDEKQNYSPFFVSLLCNFDPESMTFNLTKHLSEPTTKIPPYYKLSKDDKSLAIKERIKRQRTKPGKTKNNQQTIDGVNRIKKSDDTRVFEKPKLLKK